MSLTRRINLPLGTTVWVLLAHAITVASPLCIIAALSDVHEELGAISVLPAMWFWTAIFMALASVFEVIQNTVDRWHLTAGQGSTDGRGLMDMLFQLSLCIAFAFQIAGVHGGDIIYGSPLVFVLLLFPVFYYKSELAYPIMGMMGFVAMVVTSLAVGHGWIFTQLIFVVLSVVWLNRLMKTGEQWLHGYITLTGAAQAIIFAMVIRSIAP